MSAPGNEAPSWMPALRALLSIALAVAAIVLGTRLVGELRDDPSDVLAAGETRALRTSPYGPEHTVLLPRSEVDLTVGRPTDVLDHELVEGTSTRDLRAPEGGTLVPLTWQLGHRPDNGSGEAEQHPTAVRLVAGQETITLGSVILPRPGESSDSLDANNVVVALPDHLELDDLSVEVEYDGLTQVLHVASGDIDAGVAEALYEPLTNFDAGCVEVEDNCDYGPVSNQQPFQPQSTGFLASYLTLHPYDHELGWADDGTLWGGVRIHSFSPDGTDAAGNFATSARQAAPRVTLDGRPLVARDGLKAGTISGSVGRAIFRVPTSSAPRTLEIRTVATLTNGARMPVRASRTLRPVR